MYLCGEKKIKKKIIEIKNNYNKFRDLISEKRICIFLI